MGRSSGAIKGNLRGRGGGIPFPVLPKESVGIMSGPIRKAGTIQSTEDNRGSNPNTQPRQIEQVSPLGQRPLYEGEQEFAEKLRKDREAGVTRTPEEESKLYKEMVKETTTLPYIQPPNTLSKPTVSPPMERRDIRLVPKETFRDDPGVDPTLGGPPEREVPIPMERDTSPRGRAPFSPNERAMARDRFYETMFNRSDERRQQRSMEREERRNQRGADMSRYGEGRMNRYGEGDMSRRGSDMSRRGMPSRRSRRRDFTRRRSRMEGGRRGRSGREMAAFRDRYVSTLGRNFFS